MSAEAPTEGDENVTHYDVVVIGGGQAGPQIAMARAGDGKRAALVEMARVGGTCLNHGCKPTKTMRASATAAHRARRAAEYGVEVGEVQVDFGAVMRRMHAIIDPQIESLESSVTGTEGLDYFGGQATLRADPAGEAHEFTVDGQTHTATEVYLDLGARAAVPHIEGLDGIDYLTDVELMHLTELPRHLVVVGGGYIGLEFGQMFRRFGSEVTMLVGHGIAGKEDPDVRQILTDVLTGEGVTIIEARPASVERSDERFEGGLAITLDNGDVVHGSDLLVASGRRSNSDLLGDHGLAVDERGFFDIGPRYQTSAPGIFALGDVNGHGAWTHTAYQDSQIVEDPSRTVTGRVTTYAMFTDPVLGRVGMNNQQAKESGRNVLLAELPMSSVSRAVLESETDGVMRILVDADTEQILGATILGLHADDLVQQISLAVQAGVPYPKLRDMLPIHPTMAEFLPFLLLSLEPLTS